MNSTSTEFNIAELKSIVHKKLIIYNLVAPLSEILLTPTYKAVLRGITYTHYIITCSNTDVRFFLKTIKERDNSLHCNKYLKSFCDNIGEYLFPIIIVPEFEYCGVKYIITTFMDGENLDTLSHILTKNEWQHIAEQLSKQIDALSTIKAEMYSENNKFLSADCATILKDKIKRRSTHPVFKRYPSVYLIKACERCFKILDDSIFSSPTLLHMDVKPANIIYNRTTRAVKLIDFEFARFGDYDFGWTQILLTQYNSFIDEYKKFVLPTIIDGRINISDALNNAKYRCYTFYQTACNLIYYYDRNIECPMEMQQIFSNLLSQLSEE